MDFGDGAEEFNFAHAVKRLSGEGRVRILLHHHIFGVKLVEGFESLASKNGILEFLD